MHNLIDEIQKINKKIKNGKKLPRRDLELKMLYHCFVEESFPGTRTEVHIKPLADVENPKHIAVVQLTKLGDVYTTFPLLRKLREKYSPDKITFYTDRQYKEALSGVEEIDEVVVFPVDSWRKKAEKSDFKLDTISSWIKKQATFDLMVNCHDSLRSALFCGLMQSENVWGLNFTSRGLDVFSTTFGIWKVYFPYVLQINGYQPRDVTDRFNVVQQNLLRFGFDCKDSYKLNMETQEELIGEISPQYNVGLIIAGGWETKKWPLEHWEKLIESLAALDVQVHLIGGPDVKSEASSLSSTAEYITNWVGKTDLGETASVLNRMDIVISNDTGPLHLAGWLGKPVIALCGPTLVGASGMGEGLLLRGKIECSGCQKDICNRKDDKLGCLKRIKPRAVYDILEKFKAGSSFADLAAAISVNETDIEFFLRREEEMYHHYPVPEIYEKTSEIGPQLLSWLATALLVAVNELYQEKKLPQPFAAKDWFVQRLKRPVWNPKNYNRIVAFLIKNLEELKQIWGNSDTDTVDFSSHKPLGPFLAGLSMIGGQDDPDIIERIRAYQKHALEVLDELLQTAKKEGKKFLKAGEEKGD